MRFFVPLSLLLSLLLPTAICPAETVLVEDYFADGGTTQGDDPLDVNWVASGGSFQVVEDALLNPVAPHRAAELFINSSNEQEKDEYLSFRLPGTVSLAVGESLQIGFSLRFVDGPPRIDASRTGVSLAYHPNSNRLSPWADAGNREYALYTSYGFAGTLGRLHKSEGVQFLNSWTVLAENLHSVDLNNEPGSVLFMVDRLDESTARLRYRLDNGPWQEAIDQTDPFWDFNQVHFRYRRSGTEPLEKMRLSAVRVVITEVDYSERLPVVWWVNPNGSDGHTGDSLEDAFATINRALLWSRPGDTINLTEGLYRETVQPTISGLPGEPITIRAYPGEQGPDSVTVSGFTPFVASENNVGEWENHSGAIWKIQLPPALTLSLGQNLVMLDGEVLLPARWPSASAPVDFDRRNMARATAGTIDLESRGTQPPYSAPDFYSATYTAAELTSFSTNSLTGAHLDLCPGHNWWHKGGVVTGNDGDTLHFRFRFAENWPLALDTPKQEDRFAIWGHLATLDTPGEFFIDVNGLHGPAHTLYVWLPDSGSPHGRSWEILSRAVSLQAGHTEHLNFENIRIRGGAIHTGIHSAHLHFDGVDVEYGAVNRNLVVYSGQDTAVLLNGSDHQFHNGRIAYTDGRSLFPRGIGHQISNNVIKQSTSHLLSLDELHGGDVRYNTAFNSGNTVAAIGAKASFIGHNHLYRGGMRITDIALMNTWDSGDMEETEIAYNWVHTNLAPRDGTLSWWGGQGIRLDSGYSPLGCSNALIHHNVVWGTTASSSITAWGLQEGMENYGNSKIRIFQNTMARNLVLGGSGSNAGTIAERNIATGFTNAVGSLEGASLVDNLFVEDLVTGNLHGPADFISPVNRNYQLRPSSPAYNTGNPIPDVTESGPYAYLGAYNPANGPWWPGARVRQGDLLHLQGIIETDALGKHWLVIQGAPEGRTFPESFTVQLGDLTLQNPKVVYCFNSDMVEARMPLAFLPDGASLPLSVSLDGVSFQTPVTPSVSVPHPTAHLPESVITTHHSGTTISIELDPAPTHLTTRFPLSFAGLLEQDLTRDAIPWIVDTRSWASLGMDPEGRDLRFFTANGKTPLRFHIEAGLGTENTLFWLLRENSGENLETVASFIDESMLYVGFGDGIHYDLDDPTVLTESYPALDSPALLLHLRATSLTEGREEGDPISTWPDLSPGQATVVAPQPSMQPTWHRTSFAGLPAVAFDGATQHLQVNGAEGLGTGPARYIAVYRNPDPGSRSWQRVISARANQELTDWETGVAIIPPNSAGTILPNHEPIISDANRQAEYSRENFTVAKRALSEAEWFRGEIAEIIAFEGSFMGAERDALYRYLRRKYNIVPRPVATFDTANSLPSLRLWLGDTEVESFSLSENGVLEFILPLLESDISPASLDLTLQLADGSLLTIPAAVWVGHEADVWRMENFGPDKVIDPDFAEDLTGWLADPDGDGLPNLVEFALGTDPLDPGSAERIRLIHGEEGLRFDIPGLHSQTRMHLERSSDLKDWTDLGEYLPGTWFSAPLQALFWRLRFYLVED